MNGQERPAVAVYIATHEIRPGIKGCECPICAKWSFLDMDGRLSLPAGCPHAFGSEAFSVGLDYIMFSPTPTPNQQPRY